MAATSFKIRGIAPPDLQGHPPAVRKMFWQFVVDIALKVKDAELAAGLDRDGVPLRPIAPATRKHRRSAMTPSGKGNPAAPPLTPAYQLSRTRSLLAGRALTTHAEFYWRYDPFTGDSWGKVLAYQAAEGRNVFGISPRGTAKVKAQAWARWERWKAGQLQPEPAKAAVETPAQIVSAAPLRGWNAAQFAQHFRQPNPTPVPIPGRPAGAYPRVLAHVWGGQAPPRPSGPKIAGPTAPRPPKAPQPKVKKAAVKPAPKAAPKPAPPPPQAAKPPGPPPSTLHAPPARTVADMLAYAKRIGHELVETTGREMVARHRFQEHETAGVPLYYWTGDKRIYINTTARTFQGDILANRREQGKQFVRDDLEGMVDHEVAHLLHHRILGARLVAEMLDKTWLGDITTQEGFDRFVKYARAVSGYAATMPAEFVAEVYSGLKIGRVFPQWVMDLYNQLEGPIP